MDYDVKRKKPDTENTRCVLRRSGDNDLSPDPEECATWVTKAEHERWFDSENRQQRNSMKLDNINWPISTTKKEVKSLLGFGSPDKELVQNNEDWTKPRNKQNTNGQDNVDIIILPERLSPDSLNQKLDDEQIFEKGDEQFDAIKSYISS